MLVYPSFCCQTTLVVLPSPVLIVPDTMRSLEALTVTFTAVPSAETVPVTVGSTKVVAGAEVSEPVVGFMEEESET